MNRLDCFLTIARLSSRVRLIVLAVLILLGALPARDAQAGGVTVVTHGFQSGDEGPDVPWLDYMGDAIAARIGAAGGYSIGVYRMVVTGSPIPHVSEFVHESGNNPFSMFNGAGHAVIKVYWDTIAAFNEAPTFLVASAVLPYLLDTPAVAAPELDLNRPLAELPIHLIGHSRGGSLVAYLARRLGENGIAVDQMTLLDPHPVEGWGDEPMAVWENVTFADNYFRTDADPTDFNGEYVDATHYRILNEAALSLFGYSKSHSDVHLWYHGTINTATEAFDGEYYFSDPMRQAWFAQVGDAGGANVGYHLSRHGGGWIKRDDAGYRLGLSFLAGGEAGPYQGSQRELTNSVASRVWPNVIDIKDTRSGKVHQTTVRFRDAESVAWLTVGLDSDQSPYYSDKINFVVDQPVLSTASEVTVEWNEDSVPPGATYWLFGSIYDGSRERHYHHPIPIQIAATPANTRPNDPTLLETTSVTSSRVDLRWRDNSPPNESGFLISWTNNSTGDAGSKTSGANSWPSASTSVTGLAANTSYTFRVYARNGSLSSNSSNALTVSTNPAPAPTYTLTIQAIDLDSVVAMAVPVYTWTGASTALQEQTTPFTRQFAAGIEAKFAGFPTVGAKQFRYMLVDGAPRYDFTESVQMTGNKAVVLYYGSSGTVGKTLVSLAIEGPSAVDERSAATYRARATYSDATSAIVSGVSWDDDSSYADISSSGVLDTSAVSSDRTVEIEATYTAGGVTSTATRNVTIRNVTSTQTYTLTRNVVGGGRIGYSPQATNYAAGTVVSLHGNEDGGWLFSHWSGDASGTDDDTTVRMDGNRTVTAHFVADTSEGWLRVNLSPPQAIAETAQWKYRNYTAWRDSGNTQGNIPVGAGYVQFKDIPGWITPDGVQATILGGQTVVVNATYREIKGAVQVTITPPQAVQAGARWRLNGGAWRESGTTVADAPTGANTIEFLGLGGWGTPSAQAITVTRGITTVWTGDYAPPAGLPIITSVAPRTGPIAGGTTVTFEGANFLPGATVTFGGVPATSVTVVSATRITAVSPARASYGTVPLALTSGGQTVAQANGFSYLNPLGQNLELISQIGGRVEAVAVSGTTAYIGEGTSFVVLDVANPASPIERGRISLPGVVRDIVVTGTTAFVACASSGLYSLNVATPSAPAVLGFYDTPGDAYAAIVDGAVAYVADAQAGLQVLNVSDPSAITLISTLNTPGTATRLALATINGTKVMAIADREAGIRIVNVTIPATPLELAAIPRVNYFDDIDFNGATLFGADSGQAGVLIYSLASPSTPQYLATYDSARAAAIDATGGTLYTASGEIRVINVGNPSSPQLVGTRFDLGGLSSERLVVSAGYAFIACRSDGLRIVAISNPSAMSIRGFYTGIGDVSCLTVVGNNAYIGGDSGLHVVDFTNPGRPVRISDIATDQVGSIAVSNGKAYLEWGNLRIVNLASSPPTIAGTFSAIEALDLSLLGNSPILVGETVASPNLPRIELVNVSNPASPQSGGALNLDSNVGYAHAIAVAGNWGVVARGSTALDIVNLSNPAAFQRVSQLNPNGYIYDVSMSSDGNITCFGDTAGLRVVNTTNKNSPLIVATIDPPESVSSDVHALAQSGSRVYFSDVSNTYVYDISDPATATQIAIYDTVGSQDDIVVSGDLVFVASAFTGVSVLRLLDTDKPTVTITTPTTNTAYPAPSALLTLGGTATDLQGVVRVTWENDRGGGGVATGTNSWTIPNLQLAAGVNVLTVTAEDAQGNFARDSLTVTATLPESAGPSILITGPQPPPAFTFLAATLPLTGTAADASGVQVVTWANDRGGSGTATGTTAWSAAIPLLDGPNRITVTAHDTVGNVSQAEVLVTYLPPDTTPPTVSIAFPTDAQEAVSTEFAVNLSGEADDDRALARVEWANNRGGSGTATGTRAWWANGIALQPGVNVLSVTAYDEAGNTRSDTLSMTYAPPFTVTPVAGANGSLSPGTPQSVNPGGSVLFTATAAAGYRVAQWLVNGQAAQQGGATFTLTEVAADATVQATFAVVIFTLRSGAGTGGTIAPTTEQTVAIGGSATFTATPLAGYVVDQWLVNGAPAQIGGTTLTLATVTGNAAVQVTFRRIPPRATIARESAQPPGAGHQMRLIFTGLAGRTYRVEYADNLATDPIAWQVVGTVTADGNGEFELVDPPPLPGRRFYRAVEE